MTTDADESVQYHLEAQSERIKILEKENRELLDRLKCHEIEASQMAVKIAVKVATAARMHRIWFHKDMMQTQGEILHVAWEEMSKFTDLTSEQWKKEVEAQFYRNTAACAHTWHHKDEHTHTEEGIHGLIAYCPKCVGLIWEDTLTKLLRERGERAGY